MAYGALSDEDGSREFVLTLEGNARGMVVASITGIEDRDSAEALRGTRLYVERARLPPPDDDDDFYHADLLGLEAVGEDGAVIGRVSAILPAGGSDVLEIERAAGALPLLIPFTREAVPAVEIARGRIVVIPPEDFEQEDGEPEDLEVDPDQREPDQREKP